MVDEKQTNSKEFEAKLKTITTAVTENLEKYQIGVAADTLYNEFWHWFCDQCIEDAKKGKLSKAELLKGLILFVTLLHPYMPFVTEAIWQTLQQEKLVEEKLLIHKHWPST